MKRAWIVGGLACVVGSSGTVEAATSPPEIKVEIDGNFKPTVSGPANCIIDGWRILSYPAASSGSGDNSELQALLTSGAECPSDPKNPKKGYVRAKVVTTVAENLSYPYPVMPREYQWSYSEFSWRDILISQFGLPSSCQVGTATASTAAAAAGGNECRPIRNGAAGRSLRPKPIVPC